MDKLHAWEMKKFDSYDTRLKRNSENVEKCELSAI